MKNEQQLGSHILPTAGAMVGVCMTVISIVKLTQINKGVTSWIDEILSVDALLFLLSAIFSYLSLRDCENNALELVADKIFVFALALMGLTVIFLTFELV